MTVLLEIKNERARALLDVLNSLPYVKTTTLTEEKALFLNELKDAVEEVKQIRAGKIKGRNARKLIDEL